MMWILLCLCALFAGSMLYLKIEPDLPEQLQLSKYNSPSPASTRTGTELTGSAAPLLTGASWRILGDGRNVELVRDFDGRIEAAGRRYDAPTLVLTCFEGELFARVSPRMALTNNGKVVQVTLTGSGAQQWRLGEGNDIYSPAPKGILASVQADKAFRLTLPYAELGVQSVTFTPTGGQQALAELPPACKR